jgi:hypothetical protein
MMHAELPLTKLLLDRSNPRLEVQPSHRDAVREIFKLEPRKMLRMAEDIVERRGLNPLEKIGVSRSSEHKDRYVVHEGNRRVAALIALHNPDIVKGAVPRALEQRLAAISQQFVTASPTEFVPCEVLSPEDLLPWIALRHTGENKGAGLVPWGAVEQGRFIERTSGRKSIELQFLDQHRQYMRDDPAAQEYCKSVPLTTLKRLLNSKPVRERLGITVTPEGWAYSSYPVDELNKWLRRVINDVSTGKKKVSDLYTGKQMAAYIDSLGPGELPSESTLLSQPVPVEPVRATGNMPPLSKRQAKAPTSRKWSIRDLGIKPTHQRLRDILDELAHLPIEKAPNVHAVMLRVFVELSVDDYVRRNRLAIPANENTLKYRVNAVVDHLKAEERLDGKQATAVNRMTSHERFLSTKTLQQFVHNEHLHPSPFDVENMWRNLGPFLAVISS